VAGSGASGEDERIVFRFRAPVVFDASLRTRGNTMRAASILLTTAAVVCSLPLSGCYGDEVHRNAGPATSFYGTYADQSGNAGTVELIGTSPMTSRMVLAQDEGTALDGELRIGARRTIALKGLYDAAAGSIAFASEDGAYEFNGAVAADQASGYGLGPDGPATFVVFVGGTAVSVDTFCATATCTSPPGCDTTGSFNLAVTGSQALMTGTVDGTVAVATGTSTATGIEIAVAQEPVNVTIEGDIQGNTVSGTWTDTANGTSGTWTGSAGQCQTDHP